MLFFQGFWVSAQKPPGGKARADRRHNSLCHCSWFLHEPPGGDEDRPSGVTLFTAFLIVLDAI